MKKQLSMNECENIITGEVISLTAVMAIVAIAVAAVIVYRLFMSKEGSATMPGGWKFSWE
ncbi:MAG: hypothetical protein PUG55_06415 [Bacillales bacterium]|nr:hypothetical protein [Bacillales bacterium]MDY6003667.1 hypothetical protein [Bacilli bacterium]